MSYQKTILTALIPFILMSAAYSHKTTDSATTTVKASSTATLQGRFTRSFEIYEIAANGKTYYVSDPEQRLLKFANKHHPKGYYKSFDTCVVGHIDANGRYGPLGRYQQQITISDICS